MTSREKLIKLLDDVIYNSLPKHNKGKKVVDDIADYLLENGVVVPPDELYTIVDKGTRWANVMPVAIEYLPLFAIKNPIKNGYYFTKEEALKECKKNDG